MMIPVVVTTQKEILAVIRAEKTDTFHLQNHNENKAAQVALFLSYFHFFGKKIK